MLHRSWVELVVNAVDRAVDVERSSLAPAQERRVIEEENSTRNAAWLAKVVVDVNGEKLLWRIDQARDSARIRWQALYYDRCALARIDDALGAVYLSQNRHKRWTGRVSFGV